MFNDADRSTIANCAKRKDREGLVQWVRSKRNAFWIFDTSKELTLSHFTDVNSGIRSIECLDFNQSHTIDAFREWLIDMLSNGRAAEISEPLQSMAANLLRGNLDIPTKRGRSTSVSTTDNILLGIACVEALMEAGVPQRHAIEDQGANTFTAVSIVAQGLNVSTSSLRAWLATDRKHNSLARK